MSELTVVRKVQFDLEEKGRKRLRVREADPVVVEGERIPRKTQLLAIALRFDEMIIRGEVGTYAEIACLCGVSRARVSQIMGLVEMSKDDQNTILLASSSLPSRGSKTSP
ncbi:MAG: hypothetical protein ABIF77_19125 [bacterium]